MGCIACRPKVEHEIEKVEISRTQLNVSVHKGVSFLLRGTTTPQHSPRKLHSSPLEIAKEIERELGELPDLRRSKSVTIALLQRRGVVNPSYKISYTSSF